jgi:hypothetical protein
MRGDVITLDSGGTAISPLTGEVQVVSTLAADMALADMVLGVVSKIESRVGGRGERKRARQLEGTRIFDYARTAHTGPLRHSTTFRII